MSDYVRDDYAIKLTLGGSGEILFSPSYDAIHRFRFIGWGILRVVTEEGMAHIHINAETCEAVSEASGVPITDFDFICRTDYETYLESSASMLDDSWLDGDVGED